MEILTVRVEPEDIAAIEYIKMIFDRNMYYEGKKATTSDVVRASIRIAQHEIEEANK